MFGILKQSTAATIALGPFVDATDGFTPETALTISQADIRVSKNGAAFAQTNNSAGATAMEFGYYSVPLDTTDTNTVGRLTVAVYESGARPVLREYLVLSANLYDTFFGTNIADAIAQKIAHILLRRTMTNVEASADGDTLDVSSVYGLIQMLQEASISSTTMTIKKVDGTTTLGTKTVSKTSGDAPIRGVS